MEQEDFYVREELHNCILAKEERPYQGVVIPRDMFETE